MPRIDGVFQLLPGTYGEPDTTIKSVTYNAQLDDFANDANGARPISAGGTGATTASGARTALGVPTGTSGAVLPFLNTANTWSGVQTYTSTSANPNVIVERTGNTVNSHIGYKTDAGTIYAGMGASMTWAVGSSTNLASSPWLALVSSGAMTLTGTAPSVLLNDTGGGVARISGDSNFGSIFIEADINAGFGSSVIGFKIDNADRAELDSTGVFKIPALGHSATGTRNGKSMAGDIFDSSRDSTGSVSHFRIYNPNGQVGGITSNLTGTAFVTTSDERYKLFRGEYSGEQALAIILSDPTREWDWVPERGGGWAVGWGAQTSYAVSSDLAVPGGWYDPLTEEPWIENGRRWIDPETRAEWEEGGQRWIDPTNGAAWEENGRRWVDPLTNEPWEEGGQRWTHLMTGEPVGPEDPMAVLIQAKEINAVVVEALEINAFYRPWSIDQSKRTPYLWAATGYLSKIIGEQATVIVGQSMDIADLQSRIAALEAGA